MNKPLIIKLFEWSKPYITGVDLRLLLGGGEASRQGKIKRAVKEGLLVRLCNDFYLIQPQIEEHGPADAFEIAPLLYGPSYISGESALQYHGWIPEATAAITSTTSRRSRQIATPIALFTYAHIPLEIFAFGVTGSSSSSYLIAHPWKAAADLLYTQKRNWPSCRHFCEDMRIEKETIENTDRELLVYLAHHYPNRHVQTSLQGWL